jgi:DNA-binding transcriptional LysR family regulator
MTDPDFEHAALLEDEYVLLVAAGSRDRAAPPALEELATMPLIGFLTGKVCQLTDYFRASGLEPGWIVGSHDIETIYSFVAANDGVALLPRLATLSLGPGVDVVDLACGLPPRRIGLAWSKLRGESGSADAFVRAATAEAARFSGTHLAVAS